MSGFEYEEDRPDVEDGEGAVEEEETPDSIDVQPEDPRHPGSDSPEPID